MQSDLGKLKDSFSEIISLRTQFQFSSALLQREVMLPDRISYNLVI